MDAVPRECCVLHRHFIVLIQFQLAVIAQGIAARYARRQASSEKAPFYSKIFPLVGRLAQIVLEDEGIKLDLKAKL